LLSGLEIRQEITSTKLCADYLLGRLVVVAITTFSWHPRLSHTVISIVLLIGHTQEETPLKT